MRKDRNLNQLRNIEFIGNFSQYAEGSCLVKFGNTHVLCTASLDQSVPRWLKGQDKGWVTAEYGMLPRATHDRVSREAKKGQQSGRTQEIQRLIGRSLRAIVDPSLFKEMQILIDCDVIQADGGTRTAAISGAFIALHHCFKSMIESKIIKKNPIIENLAAISCGVISKSCYLDLDYHEDQSADVDSNFVITESGKLVEVQLTSEGEICEEDQFNELLKIAKLGVAKIINEQKKVM